MSITSLQRRARKLERRLAPTPEYSFLDLLPALDEQDRPAYLAWLRHLEDVARSLDGNVDFFSRLPREDIQEMKRWASKAKERGA